MTSDEIVGRDALVYFHNECLDYPENYHFSYEQLIDELQKQSKGQFLDGFGFAISSSNADQSQVKQSMIWLAKMGKGHLPQKWNAFFQSLSNQTTSPSFISAAVYTVEASSLNIAHGAQAVGDAVISTGKTLTTIGPIVAVAAILFIVFMRTKKIAGA